MLVENNFEDSCSYSIFSPNAIFPEGAISPSGVTGDAAVGLASPGPELSNTAAFDSWKNSASHHGMHLPVARPLPLQALRPRVSTQDTPHITTTFLPVQMMHEPQEAKVTSITV